MSWEVVRAVYTAGIDDGISQDDGMAGHEATEDVDGPLI
jgi:hypothetical protein